MGITLSWPVSQHTINQNFMENKFFNYAQFGHPGHEGIDFPVNTGTPVMACADGVVVLLNSPYERAYGIHVWVRHDMPDGSVYRTLYAHLSQINVSDGQRVKAGDVVGLSGNSGNSTGPHLHLSLKKDGASARGETAFKVIAGNLQKLPGTNTFWAVGDTGKYQWDYIDPTPFLSPPAPFIGVQNVPPAVQPQTKPTTQTQFKSVTQQTTAITTSLPDHPLRGMHGEGAADWMLKNKVKGWAVEPVYYDSTPAASGSQDYSAHEKAGIRVIVRWNYSKSKSESGQGVFPPKAKYKDFVNWCIDSISASKGVWGNIIGREPNRADQAAESPLQPQDVVTLYNDIWYPLPKGVRCSPPALDPCCGEIMDPRDYWQAVLQGIKGAEFFALHAYSYGSTQAANNNDLQKSPAWQYQSFRMWEPLAATIYKNFANYRHIPLVISETNHFRYSDAALGWDDNSPQWVKNVMQYVYDWNHGDGDQYAHAICLHCYPGDGRGLQNRNTILDVLTNNGDKAI